MKLRVRVRMKLPGDQGMDNQRRDGENLTMRREA
jgi:hypothetical protein